AAARCRHDIRLVIVAQMHDALGRYLHLLDDDIEQLLAFPGAALGGCKNRDIRKPPAQFWRIRRFEDASQLRFFEVGVRYDTDFLALAEREEQQLRDRLVDKKMRPLEK